MTEGVYATIGRYYGYPVCCCESFCAYQKNLMNGKKIHRNPKAHGKTGFLPCEKHERMIISGQIKIADLIQNRICKTPFPNDGGNEGLIDMNNYIESEEHTVP